MLLLQRSNFSRHFASKTFLCCQSLGLMLKWKVGGAPPLELQQVKPDFMWHCRQDRTQSQAAPKKLMLAVWTFPTWSPIPWCLGI